MRLDGDRPVEHLVVEHDRHDGRTGALERAIVGAATLADAAAGGVDRERVVLETLTSIRRAGASIVLTYYALEAAQLLG